MLRVVARWLEIGPDAKIGGKLIYRSPQLAKIDPTALIAGGVTHVPIEWPSGELGSLTRVATWISIVLLVGGLTPLGRRTGTVLGGACLAAGFICLIVATRWGHFH